MKHIFIVETADTVYLSPPDIDILTAQVEGAVQARLNGYEAFALSICNQRSALRGVYTLYGVDQAKSPDQLGSAKN